MTAVPRREKPTVVASGQSEWHGNQPARADYPVNHDALIEEYLAGPGVLRRAVAGMTRDQLLVRPVPGKWSTQEVVCHLADYEPIYADRRRGRRSPRA